MNTIIRFQFCFSAMLAVVGLNTVVVEASAAAKCVKTTKNDPVWRGCWKNGEIRYENQMRAGKRHGVCKVWDRYGKLIGKYNYKNGLLDGKQWELKGDLVTVSGFRNGVRHGNFAKIFKRAKKYKVKGQFVDGKADGLWKYFKPGGIKTKEVVFDQNDAKSFTKFYPSGKKMMVGQGADGKQRGTWTQWSEYGKIQWVRNYKDGKRHGESRHFHPRTGELLSISNYQKGLQHGVEKRFSTKTKFVKGGVLTHERYWKKGKEHGTWRTFSNGDPHQFHDVNGNRNRKFKAGEKTSETVYRKGKQIRSCAYQGPRRSVWKCVTYR